MKNFNIMAVYWKIQFLERVHEKPICRGELPNKEGIGKKEGDSILRGFDQTIVSKNYQETNINHF